jgi:nucleoside-diphosphate-sugar epimerase
MGRHVVVGAGGIGRCVAAELAARGHQVILVSRSGKNPGIPGVQPVVGDASDAVALTTIATGADSLVNAMNPSKYHQWRRDWPPAAAGLLAAAERTGAGLVTVSNLYLYGRVEAPMVESTPVRPHGDKGRVRAQMWADALEAHRAGRVRVAELRASDYFGPGAGARVSLLNEFVIAPAAAGKPARLIVGKPDTPHSWTYLPDIGKLAATLATGHRSWGRAWHVPTSPAKSMAAVAADIAAAVGRSTPLVRAHPRLVKLAARVMPVVRELDETAHQFERPFVLDSTAATSTFGLEPTPWADALATTIDGLVGSRSSLVS